MSMITSYEKPQDLDAATRLLAEPGAALLGGGARIVPDTPAGVTGLIDLGGLKLGSVVESKGALHLGSGLKLRELVARRDCDGLFAEAALVTAPSLNLRNQMTLGGEAAWRSPTGDIQELHTALLAADAVVHRHGDEPRTFGEYLPAEARTGIITAIEIPLSPDRSYRFAAIEAARGARPSLALAMALTRTEGRFANCRIAVSVPGQPATRLIAVEQVLEALSASAIDTDTLIAALPDLSAFACEIRRQWITVLIIRFLADLTGEASDEV
ncbi:MAG: hypothetical protein GY835_27230 [bacterium]|nr:hypothetical protein [bacterium]